MVKNLSAMQETWVRSLGQEDPLEEEMATHSTLGSPIFPSGCEGKLGVALESLQGRRDVFMRKSLK